MVLGWEVDLETPQHISELNSAIAFLRLWVYNYTYTLYTLVEYFIPRLWVYNYTYTLYTLVEYKGIRHLGIKQIHHKLYCNGVCAAHHIHRRTKAIAHALISRLRDFLETWNVNLGKTVAGTLEFLDCVAMTLDCMVVALAVVDTR